MDCRERGGTSTPSYAGRALGILLRAGFSHGVAGCAFLTLDSSILGFERQRSNLSWGDEPENVEAAQDFVAAIPEGACPSRTRVAAEYAERPFDFGLGPVLDGLQRPLA